MAVEERRWHDTALRRGWTTGACTTAAALAACTALRTGRSPDPPKIRRPLGHTPSAPMVLRDDLDATHGALMINEVVVVDRDGDFVARVGA